MTKVRILVLVLFYLSTLFAQAKTYRAVGEISFSFMADGKEVKLTSKSASILYNDETKMLKIYLKTPSFSDGTNRAAQYYFGDNLYFELNVRQISPSSEERKVEAELSNSNLRSSELIQAILRSDQGLLNLSLKGKVNLSKVFNTAGSIARVDLRRVDIELLPVELNNLY